MSKALSAANIDKLTLADGKQADWRADLAGALLTKQREDGSWANANGRWMESNPVLVTAYAVMSLEQLYYSIPEQP
jgi:squalene-hopene/tetraprenyl-beta-curcumene cyclase